MSRSSKSTFEWGKDADSKFGTAVYTVGTQVFRAPAPTLADARHLRDLLQRRLKERGSISSMDVMFCAAQIAAAGVLRPPESTK